MIKKLISSNETKKVKIVVIGDIAIDNYKYGKISRISPEFPLPILNSTIKQGIQCLGMAGNVCYQMKHFNCDVILLGFVDPIMSSILNEHSFNSKYCVDLINGKNPIKVRFYEDDFPLFRWDIEQPNYGESNLNSLRDKLFENFNKIINENEIDIVILSDYNKGVFEESLIQKLINSCNNKKIPTIVDPKNPPLSQWRDCTYFKPNSNEIKKLTKDGIETEKQILQIKKELNCKGIVVTQAGDGIVGLINNEKFTYKPKENSFLEKVNSRIGAGDAYLAVLSICLGHGIEFEEGCKIAFEAGSKYVQSKHNKPVSIFDIKQRVDPIKCKILSVDELKTIMEYSDKCKWVWTNGAFDVSTHAGHLKTLEIANKMGDKVIVGLNTDESVSRLKGPTRPVLPFEQRAEHLAHLQYVDFIVPISDDTPREIIKKLKPNIIIKGEEYRGKYVAGTEDMHEWGGEVFFVPMIPNISTTKIIEKIKSHNGE